MKIKVTTALLAVLVSVCAFTAPASAMGDGHQLHCETTTRPVKLSATDTTTSNVKGWLCAEGNFAGKTVQVLVSGFTYDHNYWDFPQSQPYYSYVHYATELGYATFNIDRIGVGQSDHPAAALVTMPSEAYVVRQLVRDLRSGAVANTPFTKVVGVGHSMGAGIWMVEAGSIYPDISGQNVDGVILADYTHKANLPFIIQISAYRYPAQQDPKFMSAGLPDGYITSIPGSRGSQFYNQNFADARVIAKDEVLKQTATSGEAATINTGRDPIYAQAIKVPVLVVVGQKDQLDCNEATPGLSCANREALKARESSYFTPAAQLQTFVLPYSGHDTNLHYDAPLWFGAANLWAKHYVDHAW